MAIEGRVAAVLNERELIINRGSSAGVTEGMKFDVLDDPQYPIRDPETNEPIGNVDRVKVRVRAVHVQEKMTVARTYETYQTRGFSFPQFSALFAPSVTLVRTLRYDDTSAPFPPIDEASSFVKVGDRVVQIVEEGE